MNNIFNSLQTDRLLLQYTESNASKNSRHAPQLFRLQSVQPPLQRQLQRLQNFVRLSTGPGLQNLPNAVIHRVEIRRVERPFRRCKVGKMCLRRFRSVGWNGILLKCPLLLAIVATGPRNHQSIQGVTAANGLVIFCHFIDENQRGLTGGANSRPNYHGLWI